MAKYEVHWLEYYSIDHLSGDWDERSQKFSDKEKAIEKANSLVDAGANSIKVYKVIKWKNHL